MYLDMLQKVCVTPNLLQEFYCECVTVGVLQEEVCNCGV